MPSFDEAQRADSATGSNNSANAELSAFFYLIVTCSQATSVHDEQGALVLFNPSCTSLLGYERGELSVMETPNIVHPEDAHLLHAAATPVVTSETERAAARVRLIRKNGDSISVELDISVARVAGRQFTVIVSTPIDDDAETDRTVTWAHAFG
ncbi:hypothetical protein GCM10007304_18290 [Rhodococcoides trifolii]|uniref:PAS domain-containing protein n=2 Tax=Rhodococcoides trifolii TaxID=908250 RepID=A0A917D079_9NOCA|nr:hypothetical protein GCM10007304_18290 [Rhodococcus trifolii]